MEGRKEGRCHVKVKENQREIQTIEDQERED